MAEPMQSRITEVTVFTDRALVTREATANLAVGEQTLIFDQLPQSMDTNSIQVGGKGAFILQDIKVQTRQLAAPDGARIAGLLADRKRVEANIAERDDASKAAESERVFLEGITKKLTAPGDAEASAPVLDPEKWIAMVKFYREKLAAIDKELRTNRKEVADLQEELSRINREIQALGNQGNKTVLQVAITVQAKTAGTAAISLRYIVRNCSWRPDYQVRADSAAKKLEVAYGAFVRQATGEDWNGVSLSLSTARPQISGRLPEANPWYLDVYRPAPPMAMSAAPMPAPAMQPQKKERALAEEEADMPEESMDYAVAAPQTGATSVVFALPGTNKVDSDNRDYKVTIAMLEYAGQFTYFAVPKLSSYAYLRAKATNGSDYPFLPGTTHVFLDGSYVADASMPLVAPGETFFADLGVDEAIKIERRLVKRTEEKPNVLTKRQAVSYEYSITIKNNRRTLETFTVSEAIPIPLSDQIAITLLLPAYAKDSEALKKDDKGVLTWTFQLEPGKQQVLAVKFTVEYPKDLIISGLE